MPEADFFQRLGELASIVFGQHSIGLCGIFVGYFFVGARAIEELRQLPVCGRKAKHRVNATNHDADDSLALLNVFFRDDIGRETRRLITQDARGNVG